MLLYARARARASPRHGIVLCRLRAYVCVCVGCVVLKRGVQRRAAPGVRLRTDRETAAWRFSLSLSLSLSPGSAPGRCLGAASQREREREISRSLALSLTRRSFPYHRQSATSSSFHRPPPPHRFPRAAGGFSKAGTHAATGELCR